ncbi:TrkH family potassium uptake protein [Facklamia sp. DSM 111018]|uniref:TrkH family potassium uptake protein n=1 Tax=Facklamia lactis TaxID=2749967 RepID=A0ABS0LQY2_9LACT|nr:potassium transporter TrkG [Facklamia lactis]MBG9986572.1 TrkH family potassium uptake protein [Facklamia lactis]
MDKHLNPRNWSTSVIITLSFISLALVGSIALSMPFATHPYTQTIFFEHFITAVSLVCVSGIASLPIGETYTIFGQIIALILIQIGGLGVITIINTGLFYLNQQLSLKNQYLIQASLNRNTNSNLFDFLKSIYILTAIVELTGSIIIMTYFIPQYGWLKGSFNSIFLAVAAFTNSGFDNIGSASIQTFNQNPVITITVALLVIMGGLGFSVWFEILNRLEIFIKQRPRHFKLAFHNISTHTRLVLTMTLFLLIGGTLLIWMVEHNNPNTLANKPFPQQILESFFKSASTRSAGYTTFSYKGSQPFTKFIYMLLATIGGAPGGTAGGLKVTTVAILYLLFRAELMSYSKVIYNKRVVPDNLVKQAVMITIFFIFITLFGYGALLLTHPHLNSIGLLFETISAMGTLGVSLDVTEHLNYFGKMIILFLTLAGRVGPITVLLAILQKKNTEIHYSEANILIG